MKIRQRHWRATAGSPRPLFTLTLLFFTILGMMLAQSWQHQPPIDKRKASIAARKQVIDMARHSTISGRTFYGASYSDENWALMASGRLFVSPYISSTLLRLQDSGVQLSTDGGANFKPLSSPFDNMTGARFYFEANEDANLYAQSGAGLLSYSDDAGETWRPISVPAGFGLGKPAPFAVLNNGETRLLLGNSSGLHISASPEDGDSDPSNVQWTGLGDFGSVTAITIAPDQDAVAVGTGSGAVHVTEDVDQLDPRSWISSHLRNGLVSVIEFDPFDPERIVAGFGTPKVAPNESVVYYSTNGGRSWHNGGGAGSTALPDAPVLAAMYTGQDDEAFLLYLVSEAGVFATSDFITWSVEAGLPEDRDVLSIGKVNAPGGVRLLAHTATATLAAQPKAATVRCTYDVTPSKPKIGEKGGTVEIKVNCNSSTCSWTASHPASSSPLKVVSGASGRGDGKVVLSVAANTSSKARTMRITIAGKGVKITQPGITPSCSVKLSQGSLDDTIGSARQTFPVSVLAPAGCSWKFEASPSGVSFSPSSGSGNRKVNVTVSANTSGADRLFVIKLAGSEHKLTQRGVGSSHTGDPGVETTVPCSVKADQTVFGNSGGESVLEVVKSSSCGDITLSSSASWLTLSSTRVTQNGPATIRFTVTTATLARTATVTALTNTGSVSGGPIEISQTVPVQPVACSGLSVSISSPSFTAAAGKAQLTIQSTGSCPQSTVTVDQSWVHVTMTSGTQGVVDVLANDSTSPRTAKITVTNSGRTVTGSPMTIRQDGNRPTEPSPCFSLDRTSVEFGVAAGSIPVGVRASRPDCVWSVGPVDTTSDPRTWARVSPTSGTGNGVVTVSVDAASLQGRVAQVQIAGILVTIRQPAAVPGGGTGCRCEGVGCGGGANMQMSIDRSQFLAAGGDTVVRVLTLNACEWTLDKNANWIVFLDSPHGIGNGSVRIRVQPNTGPSRTAEIHSQQATAAVNGAVAHAVVTQSAQ